MEFIETKLKGCYIIIPKSFEDERGWFFRSFCKNDFVTIGFKKNWVQMNHSFTQQKGTIRGMHFQNAPHKEIKLVRCIAGSVYDVVVDLRKNSKTFLQWFAIELSAKNKKMLFIPEGFAHGFQTLKNQSELIYLHSNFYNPKGESGLLYNDKLINIQWPLLTSIISDRDTKHKKLTKNFKGI
jgi:dTDP-4-dehydrorhamnose 3,5-epimerase